MFKEEEPKTMKTRLLKTAPGRKVPNYALDRWSCLEGLWIFMLLLLLIIRSYSVEEMGILETCTSGPFSGFPIGICYSNLLGKLKYLISSLPPVLLEGQIGK